jgi:hypothetical protein
MSPRWLAWAVVAAAVVGVVTAAWLFGQIAGS